MKNIIWLWSRDGAGLKRVEGSITEPALHMAAPASCGGSLVPGAGQVPPPGPTTAGMPREPFTSRCHWWSTGRWDTHPSLSKTRAVDLVIFSLFKEHTQLHWEKDLDLWDFCFCCFYLLPCQQYLGESFQTVRKMRQQFPPLKHFLWLCCDRRGLQESRFSFLCSVHVLLFLLWKQSLHSVNEFWVNDAQCRLLSTSTWTPRGVSPAESGVCWKIYLPTAYSERSQQQQNLRSTEHRMGVRVTFSWSFHWGVTATGQDETLPSINQSGSKEAPLPPNSGLQAQSFAILVLKGCANPEAKGLSPPQNLF